MTNLVPTNVPSNCSLWKKFDFDERVNANISGHPVTCDTQRCGCRAKHRARHRSYSAKVSGTNLREGRRDEILVAASRRALNQNSTHRAINEFVSRHHRAVVASRSMIDDASPSRRVRSRSHLGITLHFIHESASIFRAFSDVWAKTMYVQVIISHYIFLCIHY